ncbi:MAG: cytochrome P450 [Gemmatimonadetes bacterium]|nr:cytochrome P450 [Gemmatimonadota bacterium]
MKTALPPFDPFSRDFRANPYPAYARYREADPVNLGVAPIPSLPRCWYVFRHKDVFDALKDDRLGRERVPTGRCVGAELPTTATVIRRVARRMVLFADPPRHHRLRAALDQAWSADLYTRAEARATELAEEMMEEAFQQERFDLMGSLCLPLPVLVIADVLGIPPEDRLRLKRWSHDIVTLSDLHQDRESLVRAGRATAEIVEYLRDVIERRRKRPTDDLLGRMIDVAGEVGLDDEEVLANAVLLLVAGHETTVGLLGNGLLALLERPEEAERLRADRELIPKAVEEMLRYDSPVQMTFRLAHEDLEIGGVGVRRGDGVALILGAANRDPEVFDRPRRLDPARSPNPHLAFGGGFHTCYGSGLARREARVVFEVMLPKLGRLRLSKEPAVRSAQFIFRVLKTLPVERV